METWSLFTSNDLVVATLGILGIFSVFVVFASASTKVGKREVNLQEYYKNIKEEQQNDKEQDDAFNYDTSGK
jgi:cytosine/uracil/thiamine/allantoin permease